MDRNNEVLLTEQERADLAELSEKLSLVRAEALYTGRHCLLDY